MSEFPPSDRLSDIALTGRILGSLFYTDPRDKSIAALLSFFSTDEWVAQWPVQFAGLSPIARRLQSGLNNSNALYNAWQRLFIGPYALPSAPWGSVWLDKEKVLFGDSTLMLRRWMQERNITHFASQNEPEDHIGLLLMLAAWLAESNDERAVEELLAWHLLPWSHAFLTRFIDKADHPFYHGLGELTHHTLAYWQEEMVTPIAVKKIYL